MHGYNFLDIEQKWQKHWAYNNTFFADINSAKKKYYCLEMLPYPSGQLHMGHVRNYSIGDLIARFKLKQGYNVLHPMGWDAFGLPAENAAIEKKIHPKKWTYENIDNMRSEIKRLGFSYDWSKEIATCDPQYYKHQQKIFLDFLKNDIAYRKESVVNWDPVDQTVLSNEQVVDGRGWRSDALIERKKLTQWFIRITDYSEDLIDSLKKLEHWPEHVKLMQDKWIGKSQGANVKFSIKDSDEFVEIFTTTPETLFGASFCAISFDHPIALSLAKTNTNLKKFIEDCNHSGTSEEEINKKEKLGINTELIVLNPLDPKQEIPLFIANFVLMEYGTGAIFGCPAHDIRDHEFALRYDLEVKQVTKKQDDTDQALPTKVEPTDIMINSGFLNNSTAKDAKTRVIEYLEKNSLGKGITQYRLRDWGVSRQRYWGCPIPIIHCESCGIVPVPEKDLPVALPEDVEISGNGNPLDHHPTWKHTPCPKCNKPSIRETDTLDTFFDSSWYFLRYCNPNATSPVDHDAVNYWLSVDKYIGGIEHAVLHLLYARFFVKALSKCGYPKIDEPFTDLLTQGMVTHMSYKDKSNKWFPAADVYSKGNSFFDKNSNEEVHPYRSEKMSKSKKNVVPPVPILEKYGADTARLFMLSDSPPEKDLEWSEAGIEGCYKFLNKLFVFVQTFTKTYSSCNTAISIPSDLSGNQQELIKKIHTTIKNATESIELMHFNKSIASIRELTNLMYSYKIDTELDKSLVKLVIENVVQLINPIAPHLTEELWQILGNKTHLSTLSWPRYDEKFLKNESKKIAVQVNGKLRLLLEFPVNAPEEDIKQVVLKNEKISKELASKDIKKIVYVLDKLVNIVAG